MTKNEIEELRRERKHLFQRIQDIDDKIRIMLMKEKVEL